MKAFKKLGLSKAQSVHWDGREDIKPRTWKRWRKTQRRVT